MARASESVRGVFSCVLSSKSAYFVEIPNHYQTWPSFRCRRCNISISVLKGSFFERTKINIGDIIFLMWAWVCEMRPGCASMTLGWPKKTVINMYKEFREICSWELLRNGDMFMYGGEGHVVQIDEFVINKQKQSVCKKYPEKWVLAIYDVSDLRGHLAYIADRDPETLEYNILKFVLPGTEIWTDSWCGYAGLAHLGGVSPYIHKQNLDLVVPQTEKCTNYIERQRTSLRQFMRRLVAIHSPYVAEYIDQFVWWGVYGTTPADRFRNLVQQISEKSKF